MAHNIQTLYTLKILLSDLNLDLLHPTFVSCLDNVWDAVYTQDLGVTVTCNQHILGPHLSPIFGTDRNVAPLLSNPRIQSYFCTTTLNLGALPRTSCHRALL